MIEYCNICTEKLNKSTHCSIICPYCEFKSCIKCNKQYILESLNFPNCMNCKKIWNNNFFIENFPKTFVYKEYNQKRKELMFEREHLFIKDSMDIYLEKKKEKEVNEEINELYKQIYNYKKIIKQLSKQIDEKCFELNAIRKNHREKTGQEIKCITENCVGYLIQYQCPICEINVCSKCLCEKLENHECDPNIVQNVNLIKKECKNCPKCKVSIYKEQGCDQMWCTQCQIIFSWKSGEQIKQVNWIHNPHYLEYVRNGGNDINGCGGNEHLRLPNYKLISKLIRSYNKRDSLYTVYAQTGHIYDIILQQYERNIINHTFHTFLNERINYMDKLITKEQFQDVLVKRNKASEKFTEFSQIIQSFVLIIINIFNQILNENKIIYDDNYYNLFKKNIIDYYYLFEKSLNKFNSNYTNPFFELKTEFDLQN